MGNALWFAWIASRIVKEMVKNDSPVPLPFAVRKCCSTLTGFSAGGDAPGSRKFLDSFFKQLRLLFFVPGAFEWVRARFPVPHGVEMIVAAKNGV